MLFSKRAEYELVYLLKPQANHSIDTLSCNYRGKKNHDLDWVFFRMCLLNASHQSVELD